MTFILYCLMCAILILKIYILMRKKSNNAIPTLNGPFGLPFVGYLPFLGSKPHETLYKLGEKYGNVFRLQLGSINVVILNNFAAINEAFRKEEFLGRPKNVAFNVLMDLQGLGTLSGAEWKEQKRFTMNQLRNLGFGKTTMEEHIKNEMLELIERISKLEGKSTEIRSLLASSTSSNISALVFGKRFDFDDGVQIMLDNAIQRAVKKMGQTGFITFFPSLAKVCAYFGLFGLNGLKQDFLAVNQYIINEIEKHENTLDEHNMRDYIDCFLVKMQNVGHEKTTFTKKMLAGNVQGFFAAGSETVKTTIEWALLTMAGYQDVQEKVQQEIDCVCGRNVLPSWSHRVNMPYTQAVINEIHRWKTISPLNLLRLTTDRTTVQGFAIEPNTPIVANLWSVHYDPLYWKDPHNFDPNRFLTTDGKQLIKYETFIPFSIGKRSCPGETFAQIEVFLCLTSLLQKFNVLPQDNISFEEEIGLISHPKYPVIVKFEQRM